MHALVTGGAGYFGELLVRALLARGDSVRVLDIAENASLPDAVEILRGDIRDPSAVRRAVSGVQAVFHCVAQVPLAKDRELFESVNVGGTDILARECLGAGCRKLVLLSSSAVYGAPRKNPVTRRTSPAPREAYGRAKLAGDRRALAYVGQGLDVSIVRPRTILGHGRLGIFQIVFEWVRTGRPLYVLGGGHNRFQLVYAEDLADLCLRAAERRGPAVYLAGAERFGSMRALLTGLAAAAGSKSTVRSLPLGITAHTMKLTGRLGLTPLGDYHALMYGRELFFDTSDATRELGWHPRYSNDEMMLQSYEHYIAHREEILARRGASHHRSPARRGLLALLDRLP
ncbi:MAG TPA: NAD-dependent epimerase/dehydratase family protein [Polyangiaceae bacterium]|nr:NAD-dependent epimerase/dehydratase family protein [Polyangiaceae bacterium]